MLKLDDKYQAKLHQSIIQLNVDDFLIDCIGRQLEYIEFVNKCKLYNNLNFDNNSVEIRTFHKAIGIKYSSTLYYFLRTLRAASVAVI